MMNEFGPLNMTLLSSFESKNNLKLPKSYVEFLKGNNGGRVKNGYFKVSLRSADISVIHFFYGFHCQDKNYRVDLCYEIFSGRIPKNLVPIASDPLGNQICIRVGDNREGTVWFWEHELNITVDESAQLFFLAENISSFLSGLSKKYRPSISKIDDIIDDGDICGLAALLEDGLDVEAVNEWDYTLLEIATIKNKDKMVQMLFDRGAKLNRALELSKKNLRFFPEHQKTYDLIKKLGKEIKGHPEN